MVKAQHSVVDPDALLTVIKRHYPKSGARDCKILALNCNDNFFIKLMMRKHIGGAWLDDNYYDFHMGFIRDWVKQHMGKL